MQLQLYGLAVMAKQVIGPLNFYASSPVVLGAYSEKDAIDKGLQHAKYNVYPLSSSWVNHDAAALLIPQEMILHVCLFPDKKLFVLAIHATQVTDTEAVSSCHPIAVIADSKEEALNRGGEFAVELYPFGSSWKQHSVASAEVTCEIIHQVYSSKE